MNRVLVDTNVLLDLMIEERPGSNAAAALMDLIKQERIRGIVSTCSLKDLYYIARKHFEDDLVREWIRFFMNSFSVASVDRPTCDIAINSDEPDFEDGIIRATAELEHVDFILTRDTKAFTKSSARRINSETFIELFAV